MVETRPVSRPRRRHCQFAMVIGGFVDTYVGVGRSEDPQFSVCHRLCSSYVQQNRSLIFERGASATDALRVYKEADYA